MYFEAIDDYDNWFISDITKTILCTTWLLP